jgi:hypothetical protein
LLLFWKTRPAGGSPRAILHAWTRRLFLCKKSSLLEEVCQQCWPQGLKPYKPTEAHTYYLYNICHICPGFNWVTLQIVRNSAYFIHMLGPLGCTPRHRGQF